MNCRYVPDALSTVRAVVSNDWDALYVFQLQMAESPGSRIPNIHQGGEVEYGNVDSGDGSGRLPLTQEMPVCEGFGISRHGGLRRFPHQNLAGKSTPMDSCHQGSICSY